MNCTVYVGETLRTIFTKASLVRLEPGFQSIVDRFVSRLRDRQGIGQVMDLYACLTDDNIGQYAYAHGLGIDLPVA